MYGEMYDQKYDRKYDQSSERRRLLVFLGATAALAACKSSDAASLPAAPLREPPRGTSHGMREQQLATAWKRAQQLGKPLLVVLVPESAAAQQRSVQDLFGGLLNHGTREQLTLLGLTELACATRAEVVRVTGAHWEGEPLCVLVDADPQVAARAIDAVLDEELDFFALQEQESGAETNWEGFGQRLEQNAERRSTQLADAIRLALVPDAHALQRLAAHARAVVPASNAAAFADLATCPEGLRPADALAYAALVLAAAAEPVSAKEYLIDVLAAGVRERWVDAPVPGAHWATSTGCGVRIENSGAHPLTGPPCGMGHVPEYSRRFLYLYEVSSDASAAECK
jgi:hypothetical protein